MVCSTEVVQAAVNRQVVGSIPTVPANKGRPMKHLALTYLLIITLGGCSALTKMASFVPGVGGDKGLSVDAQIGDRENDLKLGGTTGTGDIKAEDNAHVEVNTATSEASFEKAETVTINYTNYWVLAALLAVVTLFVPSPLSYIKRLFTWRRTTPQRKSPKASEQKPK
jgi:hypothetical protein